MDLKKEFISSVKVDFETRSFYEIPFAFFAEWLNLVLAQYGYENIPGKYIVVKSQLSHGVVFSRNWMRNSKIHFELELDERYLSAVEEVFYLFQ